MVFTATNGQRNVRIQDVNSDVISLGKSYGASCLTRKGARHCRARPVTGHLRLKLLLLSLNSLCFVLVLSKGSYKDETISCHSQKQKRKIQGCAFLHHIIAASSLVPCEVNGNMQFSLQHWLSLYEFNTMNMKSYFSRFLVRKQLVRQRILLEDLRNSFGHHNIMKLVVEQVQSNTSQSMHHTVEIKCSSSPSFLKLDARIR